MKSLLIKYQVTPLFQSSTTVTLLMSNPLWFWFGQTIIKKFQLREQVGAQHQTYALGIKEV